MGTGSPLKPIILFDGVCNLCTGSVLFTIKRDRSSKFLFASLQSSFGQSQMVKYGLPIREFNTFFLLKGEKVYRKSDAALEVVRELSGLWPVLYVFKVVPTFIRNAVYDFVSKNRYKWFGKKDSCMIPTPALQARFIN
jgi:predicted DCC family thiol-disulfide oxidoreductase YuxK